MTERAPLAFNVDVDGRLLCPSCDFEYVHIDDAYVAGRPREDGPVVPVHVNSYGQVQTGEHVHLPVPDGEVGRRHLVSLTGWCESCGLRFAVEFKQHKGQTMMALRRQTWS